MNEVYADPENNRLVIKYGEITIDDYLNFAQEVLKEASKLKEGFTVFSDLRDFNMKNSGEVITANVSDITNVQRKLYEMGASEVIRVVDSQVWLFVAMQEAEKDVGYSALIFDDMDEARVALEDIESEIIEKNGEN
eukprot:gnl/Chilomastix_cuspidata/6009.p4 GENE.gnl/Chilomastix_cuspidata/6009~~gnl/Chilomastix_cuspidata/6009.p4  ORF type:complete len:136 (-),score=11.53 gnl/Chilomastix_cuspidata/6009:3558-3965(-)